MWVGEKCLLVHVLGRGELTVTSHAVGASTEHRLIGGTVENLVTMLLCTLKYASYY